MSPRRSLIALIVMMTFSCRIPRTGQKVIRGNPETLTPAMVALAPPALTVITKLRAPESVLWDPQQDVYFVSNINGGLLTRDGNGFISRIAPDSMSTELKWIEGGKNGVTLDAPKGMAVLGDILYVSDVTAVRKFDRRSGAPRGQIPLPGATLINDLTSDGQNLYVSDTGVIQGPGNTFVSTGSDAIWKITGDHAEKIAAGPKLDHPNGLDFVDGHLRVLTFHGAHLYELDGEKRKDLSELPQGQLDGLAHLSNGDVLVTSWLGKEIYRGPVNGPFHPILAGVLTPADIGYDVKRHRLLVPSSAANQVTIHSVP